MLIGGGVNSRDTVAEMGHLLCTEWHHWKYLREEDCLWDDLHILLDTIYPISMNMDIRKLMMVDMFHTL